MVKKFQNVSPSSSCWRPSCMLYFINMWPLSLTMAPKVPMLWWSFTNPHLLSRLSYLTPLKRGMPAAPVWWLSIWKVQTVWLRIAATRCFPAGGPKLFILWILGRRIRQFFASVGAFFAEVQDFSIIAGTPPTPATHSSCWTGLQQFLPDGLPSQLLDFSIFVILHGDLGDEFVALQSVHKIVSDNTFLVSRTVWKNRLDLHPQQRVSGHDRQCFMAYTVIALQTAPLLPTNHLFRDGHKHILFFPKARGVERAIRSHHGREIRGYHGATWDNYNTFRDDLCLHFSVDVSAILVM